MKYFCLIALVLFSVSAYAIDDMQMYNAIDLDNLPRVRDAIESGKYNFNSKITVDAYRSYKAAPLIIIAGKAASLHVLKYLIDNKADLNARSEDNDTALMLAAYYPDDSFSDDGSYFRHIDAVTMLLDAGASLENVAGAFTALSTAAFARHSKIVKILLDRGANPNGTAHGEQAELSTPLIMAARAGDEDIVRLILEHGANPKIKDKNGLTPLDWAKNNSGMAKMLECALSLSPGKRFVDVCR